jgi:hypothetical protein
MNEREFCYWLQGLLELSDTKTLDEKQVKIIRDHLNLVFTKVTPGPPLSKGYLWPNPPIGLKDTLTCTLINPVPEYPIVGSC